MYLTAQELSAHGFPLYYFNSKKQGELDFVLETFDGTRVISLKMLTLESHIHGEYDSDVQK